MEKLSRTKKYEQLRSEINQSGNDEVKTAPLSEYANRLNSINPQIFKKMDVQSEVPALRVKETKSIHNNTDDTFVNEYMEDFIKEVKDYNKEKGLIESDITEIDILSQLKNPVRLKRENYVTPIQKEEKEDTAQFKRESTLQQSKQEIARQIQELISEQSEANSGMNVEKVELPDLKAQEAEDRVKIHDELLQQFNEETQQLKIKLDNHQSEIQDINHGIGKTNKLLNIVLLLLVIALFVVIGVVVYMLLVGGGLK